ncbi:ribonuclease III, partial [Candidatus Saccharibacteria bacterium]|nr:ribonuclease III [Candidatus Saccharibacteria bacterium]
MTPQQIEDYQAFAREKLGFEFKDINLLITALTHRSYVNEHKASVHEHNERLEFLGDAVLELVTSDFLFRNYNEPEGIMTSWRSALVRTETISDAGIELGYPPLVRLSHGEKQGSDRAHAVIYADCFEAVIGAIYMDQGYETAKKFIKKHILTKIDQILE